MKNNIRQFIVYGTMGAAMAFAGEACGTLERPLVVVQPNSDGSYPAQSLSTVKGDVTLREGTFVGGDRHFDLACYGECEFLEDQKELSIETAPAFDFPNLFTVEQSGSDTSIIKFNTNYDNNYMGTVSLPAGIPNTWVDVELQSLSNSGVRKNLCLGIKRFGEQGFIDVLHRTSDDESANHTSTSVVLSSDHKLCFVPFVTKEAPIPLTGSVRESGLATTGDFSNIYRIKLSNFEAYKVTTSELDGISGSNGQVALGKIGGSDALMTIDGGGLFYSLDGINWNGFEKTLNSEVTSIAYGGDYWVAGTEGGVLTLKSNSNTWNSVLASDGGVDGVSPSSIIFGDNTFVALFGNKVYSMPLDEGAFSPLRLSPIGVVGDEASNITILGFTKNRLVCGTSKRNMFIYNGGNSWSSIGTPNGEGWYGRAYGEDLYIINQTSGIIERSTDRGESWHSFTEESAGLPANNITLFKGSLYSTNGSLCSFLQPASL